MCRVLGLYRESGMAKRRKANGTRRGRYEETKQIRETATRLTDKGM